VSRCILCDKGWSRADGTETCPTCENRVLQAAHVAALPPHHRSFEAFHKWRAPRLEREFRSIYGNILRPVAEDPEGD